MNPSMHRVWAAALTAAMLFVTGCNEPDRGTTGGRLDPYRSTGGDIGSSKASMPALWEYSDQVADQLALNLVNLPEITNSPEKAVLELGDLRNMTRTPTQDFELIQHRIRGRLADSKLIRNHFRIVEGVRRMDLQTDEVTAGTGGLTARYSPEITYILLGDFFQSDRGDTRRYYFDFKLVHASSRTIVDHWDMDLAQRAPSD